MQQTVFIIMGARTPIINSAEDVIDFFLHEADASSLQVGYEYVPIKEHKDFPAERPDFIFHKDDAEFGILLHGENFDLLYKDDDAWKSITLPWWYMRELELDYNAPNPWVE